MNDELIVAEIEALQKKCKKLEAALSARKTGEVVWMQMTNAIQRVLRTHKDSLNELQRATTTLMKEREMRQNTMFDNILLRVPETQKFM